MSFFITAEEGERRLNHPTNLLVRHSNVGSGNHNGQATKSGRTPGSKNYSNEIKALIGLLAENDGVKKTSQRLGIAISQVSHYKNGNTQVQDGIRPNKELRKLLKEEEDLQSATLRAVIRDKVNKIIDSIDDDKINSSNLSSATKAAANLSSVFKNFERSENPSGNTQQQFVFFGVAPLEESKYEVLEAEVISR